MKIDRKRIIDLLKSDEDIMQMVGNRIYQGYAQANTTSTAKPYIVVVDESSRPLDRNLRSPGNKTQLHSYEVSCSSLVYEDADLLFRRVAIDIEEAYPSSIIGSEYDLDFVGSTVWHRFTLACNIVEIQVDQ